MDVGNASFAGAKTCEAYMDVGNASFAGAKICQTYMNAGPAGTETCRLRKHQHIRVFAGTSNFV